VRHNISAAVLAGGKCSRMATEKSLLKVREVPLIDETVVLLKEIFPEIILVTGKIEIINRFPELRCVNDIVKSAGPLAGIYTALKTASNDAVFIFACDMPNLEKVLIEEMIDFYQMKRNTMIILVPKHKRGIEPLHAIYHKANIFQIEKQLSQKNYKISDFYTEVTTEYFEISEDYSELFYNINTKEDLLGFNDKKKTV